MAKDPQEAAYIELLREGFARTTERASQGEDRLVNVVVEDGYLQEPGRGLVCLTGAVRRVQSEPKYWFELEHIEVNRPQLTSWYCQKLATALWGYLGGPWGGISEPIVNELEKAQFGPIEPFWILNLNFLTGRLERAYLCYRNRQDCEPSNYTDPKWHPLVWRDLTLYPEVVYG